MLMDVSLDVNGHFLTGSNTMLCIGTAKKQVTTQSQCLRGGIHNVDL